MGNRLFIDMRSERMRSFEINRAEILTDIDPVDLMMLKVLRSPEKCQVLLRICYVSRSAENAYVSTGEPKLGRDAG